MLLGLHVSLVPSLVPSFLGIGLGMRLLHLMCTVYHNNYATENHIMAPCVKQSCKIFLGNNIIKLQVFLETLPPHFHGLYPIYRIFIAHKIIIAGEFDI